MKPQGARFHARDGRVDHVPRHMVNHMIRSHYLHKWPAVTRCILGMTVDMTLVGVVVFADAPTGTSTRLGGYAWELARLWIDDVVPTNGESWLIARAVRHVRDEHPEVKALASYADPSIGHQGTIYRASNWTYDGMTDEGRKPRVAYISPRTGRPVGRPAHALRGRPDPSQPGFLDLPLEPVQVVQRVSKQRFIMVLRP